MVTLINVYPSMNQKSLFHNIGNMMFCIIVFYVVFNLYIMCLCFQFGSYWKRRPIDANYSNVWRKTQISGKCSCRIWWLQSTRAYGSHGRVSTAKASRFIICYVFAKIKNIPPEICLEWVSGFAYQNHVRQKKWHGYSKQYKNGFSEIK